MARSLLMCAVASAVALLVLLPSGASGAWCDWAPSDPSAAASLAYDHSALRVLVNSSAPALPVGATVYVDYTRSDCFHCAYQWFYHTDNSRTRPQAVRVDSLPTYCSVTSRYTLTLRVINASSYNASTGYKQVLAEGRFELTERGFYTLHAQPSAGAVALQTDAEGDNAYLALFIVFPVLVVLLLACRAVLDERVGGRVSRAYERFLASDRHPLGGHAPTAGSKASSTDEHGASLHEPMLPNRSAESGDESARLVDPGQPKPQMSLNANQLSAAEAKATRADVGLDGVGGDGSPSLAPLLPLSSSSSSSSTSSSSLVARAIKGKERLLSLDSFRGLSLSLMIFVNYGGGGYYWLDHAEWNGLTVADLLFPWFVWMMGCSMPLSFASLERRGVGRREAAVKVLRRSATLLLLGVCVSNGLTLLANMRLMGVLQRFGLSYLIVGLILLYTPKLGPGRDAALATASRQPLDDSAAAAAVVAMDEASDAWQPAGLREALRALLAQPSLREYVHHAWEYLVVLCLVVVHLLVTFCLPVPGCPTGYLGPGGIADGGQFPNCVGGAAGYIDRQLLGVNHIYGSPTCRETYQCGAYDPEGLLGILTSAALCYLGVVAGRSLLWHKEPRARVLRWLAATCVCGLLALALCGGSQNGGAIPVNKNLWSLSFVLTMACFAFLVLSLLYGVIDVLRVWDGAPFRAMGQNSIMIYFLSEALDRMWPFAWQLDGGNGNTHLTNLTENVGSVVCFWIIAAYAAANGFFIAV